MLSYVRKLIIEEPILCSEKARKGGTAPEERPSETDPERQLSWRRLEVIISYMRSSLGEADQVSDEETISFDEGVWLTMLSS